MESLGDAYRLKQAGRFSEALVALGGPNFAGNIRGGAVLRAELLQGLGRHQEARAVANSLLKSRNLSPSDQSACEYVLGRILLDDGDVIGAMEHLQRSASRAQEASAFDRAFVAQLYLMAVMSDRSGPGAAAALLAKVRQLATKLDCPQVTAPLHLFVAEMEAKRGLLNNARRHSAVAPHILNSSPSTYLEAFAENLESAITLIHSQCALPLLRHIPVNGNEIVVGLNNNLMPLSRASKGNDQGRAAHEIAAR
jgi:hypothetical protein